MWLLLVGVAVGSVVVILLRALTNYEAASNAGLRDEVAFLDRTVSELTERIESLEAIAVTEPPVADTSDWDSDSARQASPRKVKTGS